MFSPYTKSNVQNFLFSHVAIHPYFRNWHQLFYNRAGLYQISSFTDFHRFGLLFPWKYCLHEKTQLTKLQYFPKTDIRLVKRRLKMIAMVQKKTVHLKIILFHLSTIHLGLVNLLYFNLKLIIT